MRVWLACGNGILNQAWLHPNPWPWSLGRPEGKSAELSPFGVHIPYVSPLETAHPLRKPAGWCASSLHKQTTICSLRLRGPLKSWPSAHPFHLVFAQVWSFSCLPYVWLPWSPLLQVLLLLPSPASLLENYPSLPLWPRGASDLRG